MAAAVYESRRALVKSTIARISRRDNDYYFRAACPSRGRKSAFRESRYLMIGRRSSFCSRASGGACFPFSSRALSRDPRYLNSLPARNACLYHRGRLLFCPRNSHFDQFEFFAGAATVDFTTETSSLLFALSPRHSFSLLLFGPLSPVRLYPLLFSRFFSLVHYLLSSAILLLFLSPVGAHTLNLIFRPTCSFRRHSDSLAHSLALLELP